MFLNSSQSNKALFYLHQELWRMERGKKKKYREISRWGVASNSFAFLQAWTMCHCLSFSSADLLLPVSYFSSFYSERACLRTWLPTLFHLQKCLGFGADDTCRRWDRRANMPCLLVVSLRGPSSHERRAVFSDFKDRCQDGGGTSS